MSPLRQLDWRVVFFALVACYGLPWLLSGAVVYVAEDKGGFEWRESVLDAYVYLYFLAMPLAAGYFTARYSKNRPQLHVLLVVLLGAAASMLVRPDSLGFLAIAGAVALLMASLGAFVALRRSRSET